MSHNIISHVLIHLLKGEELSVQKLPTHIERANAYQASFDLPWKQQNRNISLQDSQEQLACFLKYLSNRCFYLNDPSMELPILWERRRFMKNSLENWMKIVFS